MERINSYVKYFILKYYCSSETQTISDNIMHQYQLVINYTIRNTVTMFKQLTLKLNIFAFEQTEDSSAGRSFTSNPFDVHLSLMLQSHIFTRPY